MTQQRGEPDQMAAAEVAAAIANLALDEPYADPDGPLCLVSRQFLRSLERNQALRWEALGLWHGLWKARTDCIP